MKQRGNRELVPPVPTSVAVLSVLIWRSRTEAVRQIHPFVDSVSRRGPTRHACSNTCPHFPGTQSPFLGSYVSSNTGYVSQVQFQSCGAASQVVSIHTPPPYHGNDNFGIADQQKDNEK